MLDDVYVLRDRARQAASRGDLDGAVHALVQAATHAHIAEADYAATLKPLEEVLVRRRDYRSALSVAWCLAASDSYAAGRAKSYLAHVPDVDRARTLATFGEMEGAARAMEGAGFVARAAIYREKANDFRGARALWSRLTQVATQTKDNYNLALVYFNLARCARQCGDATQARDAIVSAVRLLEEAADHFETVGQRERAFDCFQVLVQIGRESQMFEDVLEGFVNCVRILREDHLKYFALQYFDDALLAAKEKGELSAAATLAHEASEYAKGLGLSALSGHYTLRQAELWVAVAEQHLARGAMPEIAENALLAAVLSFGEAGQFSRVGALYGKLATMGLEPSRLAHYARAESRYRGIQDDVIEAAPLPSHLKHENHFPDVWHVDVIEWEQQGSASEACADIMLDKRWPDLIRRKALLARLTAFAVEAYPNDTSPPAIGARVRLAEQLAQLQLYAVLSPLEKLYARPERDVKLAVLSALQTLFFKRSFVTVRDALRESDAAILGYAAKAVESLYFQHAFDPLSRIVREVTHENVRAAAIRAIARIDTAEAAEYLLGILEHGAPAERAAAIDGLRKARGSRFVELAKSILPSAPAPLAATLRDVLRSRGFAV